MKTQTALVTGAAGLVEANFVRELLAQGGRHEPESRVWMVDLAKGARVLERNAQETLESGSRTTYDWFRESSGTGRAYRRRTGCSSPTTSSST